MDGFHGSIVGRGRPVPTINRIVSILTKWDVLVLETAVNKVISRGFGGFQIAELN